MVFSLLHKVIFSEIVKMDMTCQNMQCLMYVELSDDFSLACTETSNLKASEVRLISSAIKSFHVISLVNDSSEHNVLIIKPVRYDCGDEELGSIGVFSCICH